MKWLIVVYFATLMIGGGLAGTTKASASAVSVSRTITVTAKVMPAHHIIVDGRGNIIRIDSNTREAAPLYVYKNEIKRGNEYPLSDWVYEQYYQLVPGGKARVGTVYNKAPLQKAARPDASLLTFSSYLTLGLELKSAA